MEAHAPAIMVRRSPLALYSAYVGKGWKALFRCPACGRETWQHLNFLGRRSLICSGLKITKKEVA
jgi:hypothetical protein